MAKVWISLVLLCVAITCATELEYDDYYESMADDNYDKYYDYNKPDEKNDDPDRGDTEILNNSEKETKLGDDEKVNNEESKDAAEFTSNEEDKETIDLENYDDLPGLERFFPPISNDVKEDQDADLPNDDVESKEISFDVNKDIEPIPLPPVGETEKNIQTSTKNESSLSETEEKDIIDTDLNLNNNENLKNNIKSEEDIKITLGDEKGEPDFRDILDEDSVDKAYEDLNKDLHQLMETWKKLTVTEEKNADDSLSPDNILDYEEKYGRPYNEGLVLSQRDNFYEDENSDAEVEDKSDAVDDDSGEDAKFRADLYRDTVNDENDEKTLLEDELDLGKEENADNIDFVHNDTNNAAEEVGNETEDEIDNNSLSLLSEEETSDVDLKSFDPETDIKDEISKNNDETENFNINIESKETKKQQKMYINDAIAPEETEPVSVSTRKEFRTMNVSEVSAEQYEQLMAQFQVAHRDEMQISSPNFASVPVIHIPITLDEPVYVTSPNYPNNYPSNNIIDWIFEGEGVGIELNITDFAINGVRGDYLLVKPGGIDESGTDGLVFSYQLNEPRRYRFLDVDRMFVRFVAMTGFAFFRGFKFSVRMVAPLPRMQEEIPEPEPELPEPVETLTLILGGMPALQFTRIQEEFRVLLADMALMYINENKIDPGLNSTLTVTQITNVGICNINWPNFENCTQVTFAVPLVYEDQDDDDDHRLNTEDLSSMWFGYYSRDPFAARLRRLGITEFVRPNDKSVLATWLVISLGILAITVIMGIALWRYSCLGSYTRMPEPSFRDSIYNEKQGLDLYPTPHQTLPPLYDSDYKWSDGKYDHSTRVTMDGYSNRNFTRDELSDIETDEEVISTRGRYTTDV
ncbi:unnamed protein product [Diatraea saccharalis]|uniref:CUB domain-containing protein n=1 Tax=Diatraea saccharalis TaxID=40085 RepID=A0A9N9R9M0_9NEOP|nr:unnamed protein product [Diatraea saccharalis]